MIDEHFRRSLGKDYLSIFSDHKQDNIPEAVQSSNAESNRSGYITGSALSGILKINIILLYVYNQIFLEVLL